jgi:hypothetical protein
MRAWKQKSADEQGVNPIGNRGREDASNEAADESSEAPRFVGSSSDSTPHHAAMNRRMWAITRRSDEGDEHHAIHEGYVRGPKRSPIPLLTWLMRLYAFPGKSTFLFNTIDCSFAGSTFGRDELGAGASLGAFS